MSKRLTTEDKRIILSAAYGNVLHQQEVCVTRSLRRIESRTAASVSERDMAILRAEEQVLADLQEARDRALRAFDKKHKRQEAAE